MSVAPPPPSAPNHAPGVTESYLMAQNSQQMHQMHLTQAGQTFALGMASMTQNSNAALAAITSTTSTTSQAISAASGAALAAISSTAVNGSVAMATAASSQLGRMAGLNLEITLPSGEYKGQAKGELPDGEGILLAKPTVSVMRAPVGPPEDVLGGSYSGDWAIGKFHGCGTFNFPEGHPLRTYKGAWEQGKPHGRGVLEWRDGGTLSVTFHEGRARTTGNNEGSLVMFNADGEELYTYVGRYADGYRSGKGVWKSALTGVTMEGTFKRDVFVDGVFTSTRSPLKGASPLARYEGACVDGVPGDGAGSAVTATATYHSGTKYVGQFVDGKRSGTGKAEPYAEAQLVSYEGAWADDLPQGASGSAVWVDGATFKGPWHAGKPHGAGGLLTDAAGSTFSGTFSEGRLVDGTVKFKVQKPQPTAGGPAPLATFTGKQLHGVPGEAGASQPTPGTAEYADGTTYTGPWQAGVPHGAGGVMVRPNGRRLEGRFENGLLVDGTVTEPPTAAAASVVYQGTLRGERWHGAGTLTFLSAAQGAAAPARTVYAGSFTDGAVTGEGTISYASGMVYAGCVASGLPHGAGKLSVPAHLKYSGGRVPGVDFPFWAGDHGDAVEPPATGVSAPAPVAQTALHALGLFDLPAYFTPSAAPAPPLAIPVSVGGVGAPAAAMSSGPAGGYPLFSDVATSAAALCPAVGFAGAHDDVQPTGPDHAPRRRGALPVSVIASHWNVGHPAGATAYETLCGYTFRGFIGTGGGLSRGWPHYAWGVLRMPKPKPSASGGLRVRQEFGHFVHGLLNGTGLRTWVSKTDQLRSKYGRFEGGGWRPTTAQRLSYVVSRSVQGTPKGALLESLQAHRT